MPKKNNGFFSGAWPLFPDWDFFLRQLFFEISFFSLLSLRNIQLLLFAIVRPFCSAADSSSLSLSLSHTHTHTHSRTLMFLLNTLTLLHTHSLHHTHILDFVSITRIHHSHYLPFTYTFSLSHVHTFYIFFLLVAYLYHIDTNILYLSHKHTHSYELTHLHSLYHSHTHTPHPHSLSFHPLSLFQPKRPVVRSLISWTWLIIGWKFRFLPRD